MIHRIETRPICGRNKCLDDNNDPKVELTKCISMKNEHNQQSFPKNTQQIHHFVRVNQELGTSRLHQQTSNILRL
ncbi:hypothetical protein FGIG_04501 [Fasciola gigantica]|uniref:Uncharacterized protein n=1 Tax=Fasciola gigantica TaxID=46835 RepID=A0A504YRS0_FASGI|nr:hypothetical protein FGIG_04501 [Fasciola gigantica]